MCCSLPCGCVRGWNWVWELSTLGVWVWVVVGCVILRGVDGLAGRSLFVSVVCIYRSCADFGLRCVICGYHLFVGVVADGECDCKNCLVCDVIVCGCAAAAKGTRGSHRWFWPGAVRVRMAVRRRLWIFRSLSCGSCVCVRLSHGHCPKIVWVGAVV